MKNLPTLNTVVRKWLANKLARLARRIYPESEEVMKFMEDRMADAAITGRSIVKVHYEGFYKGGDRE